MKAKVLFITDTLLLSIWENSFINAFDLFKLNYSLSELDEK